MIAAQALGRRTPALLPVGSVVTCSPIDQVTLVRAVASTRTWVLHACLLTLLCYPLIFHRLAARELWSSHEARAAQNAQSLLDSGDWLLPTLYDGRVEMQKPPMYYWMVAAIAWLRGGVVDALAVRFPAALSAWGCILLVQGFLALRGQARAGMLAGLTLATALHFTWLGRVGRIDMPLTLAVSLALLCCMAGLTAWQDGRRTRAATAHLLGYTALAAAILLKGLIGPALFAAALFAWLLASGTLARTWRERGWLRLANGLGIWWGVPLLAALALPWFVLANLRTDGEFFNVFFYRHTLQRGLGGDELLDRRNHPWWFYLVHLLPDSLPFGVLLPFAAVWLVRGRRQRREADAWFAASWLVGMIVLLSCLQFKRADYYLPAFPGLALLVGIFMDRRLSDLLERERRRRLSGIVSLAALCAAGWCVYVDGVLPSTEAARELGSFAKTTRAHAPTPQTIVLFRTESHDLTWQLGRPILRTWEWENLDVLACRAEAYWVVMPADWAEQWPQFLEVGRLYRAADNALAGAAPHSTPLVLFCTKPVP